MGKKALITTAGAGAVALAGAMAFGLFDNEPEITVDPETVEPVLTEDEKQDLLYAGATSLFEDINEAVSYGVMTNAQADEIEVATQAIIGENRPDELLDALIEANDGETYGYVSYFGRYVPHEIQQVFADYLSPQLNAFNGAVRGNGSCITGLEMPEAAGNDNAENNGQQPTWPRGIRQVQCENGNEVSLIGYPADGADVEVSYNFEAAVAYFEKTGYYARQNCDDANDCFSAIPFTDLADSEGLTQAFADKAQAEAYLSEIQTRAQSYFAEIWPQIQSELAQSSAAPAASGPR